MFAQVVTYSTLLAALFAGAVHSADGGPTINAACTLQSILATSIGNNIADQQAELATINYIGTLLKATPVNMQQFAQAKSDLLTFITTGMYIRQLNQMIVPKGNPAIAGLGVVANAQLEELNLALNLTGDPTKDNAVVTQLQTDFTGGIKKNTENQMLAMTGCPASTAGTKAKENFTY